MKVFLGFTVIVLWCVLENAYGSPQKIIFFNQFNCLGQNETKFDSLDETALNNSFASSAVSVRVVGIWSFKFRNGNLEERVIYDAPVPNGSCYNKLSGTDNPYYFSGVTRLGAAEMSSTHVVFFSEGYFQGTEISTDKQATQFQSGPIVIKSFIQFSNTSWITYPQASFRGDPTCLCPNMNDGIAPVDGYTYNKSAMFTVGSVDIDLKNVCNCDGKGPLPGNGGGSGVQKHQPTVETMIIMITILLVKLW